MFDIYGRQWESSYGHINGSAFQTWTKALATLPVKRIAAGLDSLLMTGSAHPPNLGEFMRLCRDAHLSDPVVPQLVKPWQPISPEWSAKLEAMERGEFPDTVEESMATLSRLTGRKF